MKRVFISQPMRGKSKEEILSDREAAVKDIEGYLGEKIQIVNPIFDTQSRISPLVYLARSIELLSTADLAYFAKDWNLYRGCRIERDCAEEYGIKYLDNERDRKDNKDFTFTISLASILLKMGKKISRLSWGDKSLYIRYDRADNVADHRTPYVLKGRKGETEEEWNPSVNDLFAEDWTLSSTEEIT